MSFIVTPKNGRGDPETITDVKEAFTALKCGCKVVPDKRSDIYALAAQWCLKEPLSNIAPPSNFEWCDYTTQSGFTITCKILRLFFPGKDGKPQLAELYNPSSKRRPNNSFVVPVSSVVPMDSSELSEELRRVLEGVEDDTEVEEDLVTEKVKITRTFREIFNLV